MVFIHVCLQPLLAFELKHAQHHADLLSRQLAIEVMLGVTVGPCCQASCASLYLVFCAVVSTG